MPPHRPKERGERVYCQVCGVANPLAQEYCSRCQQKLMVISGPWSEEIQATFDSNPEEQLSFDEHLLERISILEEVVRRTTDSVRQVLGTLYKLEQKFLVNQTGITSLRDLLESKRVIGREEWSELWESRLDYQLLALEKRERFVAVKSRVIALYQGDDRDGFLRQLDDAEVALLSFDIDGAMQALDIASRRDSGNHELAFFLGEVCFNEGQSDRALAYFGQVLAAKSDHFESLVYSGVLHHEAGDTERAELLLAVAVARNPDAFLPSFSLGAIYAGSGRLDDAVRHLEAAVAIDPVPRALYLLGSCLYEMGRAPAAIRHLDRAVHLEPTFEDAWHLLGLAYLERRWHKKAFEAFRRGQRLKPKKLAFTELVRLIPDGDPIAAHDDEISAGSVQGEGDAEARTWAREAHAALGEGHLHQALAHYRAALARAPENPELLVGYAMVCLELDRGPETRAAIDKAIGLKPGDHLEATAYTTLMESLRSEGRYGEVTRIGKRLLAEGRSDYAQTLAYYEMAFNLAELEEDLDDALRYARSSLEMAPSELRRLPLAALGWVHYKRRELTQAVDCLTRSNELEPSPRTLTHLGMALLAAGRRDEARDVMDRARRLGVRGSFADEVVECLKDSARTLHDRVD